MLLSIAVPCDLKLGVQRVSDADAAEYLKLMGRMGKVNLTTRSASESVHVEMEILLLGVAVLKADAYLDAAGFERLQGIMASANLLEL